MPRAIFQSSAKRGGKYHWAWGLIEERGQGLDFERSNYLEYMVQNTKEKGAGCIESALEIFSPLTSLAEYKPAHS